MTEQDYKLYLDALEKSKNAREVEVKLVGDRGVLINVVELLAQIRTSLATNQQTEIKVNIGKNISNGYFNFIVNDQSIDQVVVKNEIDIN